VDCKVNYRNNNIFILSVLLKIEIKDMVKAIWKSKVIAESDDFEIVEGNYYFPPDSVKKEYLRDSDTHTTCPWKGFASYYDIVVDEDVNKDAAWYYADPKPAASNIKNYVAFWKGVEIMD
jgi:uncharacterized protein (DUF427 family)